MLAREFANSLAILSNHYLKYVELKDEAGNLRKVLSSPISKMKNEVSEDIKDKLISAIKSKVKVGSDDLLTKLVKESGLNITDWTIAWLVNRNDFSPIEVNNKTPYPREKIGVVRVYITIDHILPGTKKPIKEDYLFISQINVVANLLPVMSKFTLYVEDALDGDEENRFNCVATSANGNIKGNSNRPWVLYNGEGSSSVIDNYKQLVTSNRGLVYLGGGSFENPIKLGIARGWADAGTQGDFGEDFHFYKNSTNKSAGYWKTEKILSSGKGVMVSEIGLCDDTSDDNLSAWHDMFGGGYGAEARKNSMFRLYGTDKDKSLTLVLGYVASKFGAVRIFKYANDPVVYLPWIDYQEDFDDAIGKSYSAGGVVSGFQVYDIMTLYTAYSGVYGGELDFSTYKKDYATTIESVFYNKDYLYSINNNNIDYPIERGNVNDVKLKSLAGHSSSVNKSDFIAIPEGYNKIYDGADLTALSIFLDKEKLSIEGDDPTHEKNKRIAYATDQGGNLKDYFKNKGLLEGNDLNLNGWVYVKGGAGEVNIEKYDVVSHGGIIVDGADICIKDNISCKNSAHLTILSLTGNIIIEDNVTKIEASLVAGGGQVKLNGRANLGQLEVKGNVVMKKIPRGNDSINSKMARGLKLCYKDCLSALPDKEDDDRSELPLLMFDLKENPKMYD